MIEKYNKGLVSVIIPTFNQVDTLERAINSVIEQTYPFIEILVIDDNDPESNNSKEVNSLINNIQCSYLTLITQDKHINGAAARNVGIRSAKGEYIAFLDDDDLWLPKKIELQVSALRNLDNSYGGVSTKKIYICNGKFTHISEKWSVNEYQNFKIMAKLLNVSTCTLLLKHYALDETGLFDENLHRHQEIQLLAFFTFKFKLGLIDEILTIIDISSVGNRPSAEVLRKYKLDYLKAIEPITSMYGKHKKDLICAHNMTEVSWAIYRDENKVIGILDLLKYCKYPSVSFYFLQRVVQKYINRKKLKKIGVEQKLYFQECITNASLCKTREKKEIL